MMVRSVAFSSVAAMLFLLPAQAAGSPPSSQTKDPNEVVCEKVELIGTRLGAKRVCATRAQWAERRRRDRDMVDQAQRVHCVKGSEGC